MDVGSTYEGNRCVLKDQIYIREFICKDFIAICIVFCIALLSFNAVGVNFGVELGLLISFT
jgi:hypothetical protein